MKLFRPPILIISLIVSMAFFSCVSNKPAQIVSLTYKLDLEILTDTLDVRHSDYLRQKFGDSLKLYINKDGSLRFDFFGNGANGYEYNLYNINTNHYYSKWKHLDSVYHYNVNTNTLKLSAKKILPSERINSIDCQVIKYEATDSLHPEYYVNQTYYYQRDSLKVESRKYKKYKEFFFYDYLSEANCWHLKKVLEMPEYRLTYSLIRINHNDKINPAKFEPPVESPLKEY